MWQAIAILAAVALAAAFVALVLLGIQYEELRRATGPQYRRSDWVSHDLG